MSTFMQGATMLGSFAIAVFFLRYWRQTRDRLFGVFALAFMLFGVNRIVLASLDTDSEAITWVYLLRALMFLAIIGAIIDKNVQHRDHSAGVTEDPPARPDAGHGP